jgi:hypothetical protein
VKRVYGVPGGSLNRITDSIRNHKAVTWLHMRNKEAAAFAAGAEAHLTGNLAVCAGICVPRSIIPVRRSRASKSPGRSFRSGPRLISNRPKVSAFIWSRPCSITEATKFWISQGQI